MAIEELNISDSGKVTGTKDALEDGLLIGFDWGDYLLLHGTYIVSVEWVLDNGLTVDRHEIVGDKVNVWVSGGKPGTTCRVGCKITTSSDQPVKPIRSVWLKIKPH